MKEEEIYIHQNNIRSKDHNVYTENNKKRALDNNDDKRYICGDLKSTLAWGHYKIENILNYITQFL